MTRARCLHAAHIADPAGAAPVADLADHTDHADHADHADGSDHADGAGRRHRTRDPKRGRHGERGISLVELLVGMVVSGLVMYGLTGFFISQSRLVGEQESQRTAREAARTATQAFMADLRRIEATGGVAAASAQEVTLFVPFALGLSCESSTAAASLLPVDSMVYANATLSGYAWRDEDGHYTYVSSTAIDEGAPGTCDSAQITTLPRGKVVVLAGLGPLPPGTPILLYERVRYHFRPGASGSALVRTRLDSGDDPEELVSFFDAGGTRFRFHVDGSDGAQDDAPADLGQLRGLELVLEGLGNRPRSGSGATATASIAPAVFFRNRPD